MSTQLREKVSRHDSFVYEQLRKAQQRIRYVDLASAAAGLVAGTLAYAVVVMLLDRGLLLAAATRQSLFLAYLVGLACYVFYFVIRPLRWRVNPRFAARQLEQTLSGSRNHVINWIDLQDDRVPNVIRSALGQRAAKDLSSTDVEEAISSRRAIAMGSLAGTLFVVFVALFLIIGPGPFRSLMERTFAPFGAASSIATRTQVAIVRPEGGDLTVTIGSPVTIVAEVTGRRPAAYDKDAPSLLYRHDQNEPFRKRFLQQDTGDRWYTTVAPLDVGNGFTYKVTAGDGESSEHRISVRAAPLISDFVASYHYRPYVRRAVRSRITRKIEDLRGTDVQIIARTNRTIREGRMEFDSQEGPGALIRAEILKEDPTALRFRFVMDRSGTYRLRFTSTEGESYVDPISHNVNVLLDAAPLAELRQPGKDIEVPVNGHLELAGELIDDVGIASANLKIRQADGVDLQAKPFWKDKLGSKEIGTPQSVNYREVLVIGELRDLQNRPFQAKPGMQLEYWLEASDACDYPRANVGESKKYKILLTEPKEDEQQKKQQQAAKQRNEEQNQQQQDQLKKENEQRNQEQQQQEGGTKSQDQKNEGKGESENQNKQEQGNNGAGEKGDDEKGQNEKGQNENQQTGKGRGEKGQNNQPGQNGNDPKQAKNQKSDSGEENANARNNPNEQQAKDEQTKRQAESLKKAMQDRSDEGADKNPPPSPNKNDANSKSEQNSDANSGKNKDDDPSKSKPGSQDGRATKNKGAKSGDPSNPSKAKDQGKQSDPQPGNQQKQEKIGSDKGNTRTPNKTESSNEKGKQKSAPQKEKSKNADPNAKSTPREGEPSKANPSKGETAKGENKVDRTDTTPPSKQEERNSERNPNKNSTDRGRETPTKNKEDAPSGKNSSKNAELQTKTGDQQEKADVDPEKATKSDVESRKRDLNATSKEKAKKDLQNLAKNAKDKEARQAAKDTLDEAEKQPGAMAKSNGKGEQTQNDTGAQKNQGSQESEKSPGKNNNEDGKGEKPGEGMKGDRPPSTNAGSEGDEQPAKPEKPKEHRASMMQLEEFRKKVDPDVLKKANMSREQYERFLEDYAELAKRQPTASPELDQPPSIGRDGTLPTMMSKPMQSTGIGNLGATKSEGRPKPPPEYRDSHREFLNRLLKPQK